MSKFLPYGFFNIQSAWFVLSINSKMLIILITFHLLFLILLFSDPLWFSSFNIAIAWPTGLKFITFINFLKKVIVLSVYFIQALIMLLVVLFLWFILDDGRSLWFFPFRLHYFLKQEILFFTKFKILITYFLKY